MSSWPTQVKVIDLKQWQQIKNIEKDIQIIPLKKCILTLSNNREMSTNQNCEVNIQSLNPIIPPSDRK